MGITPRKVLYIDCFSGAAGDMMLGALLDLGVPLGHVVTTLQTLPLDGWKISASRGQIQGIVGTDVHVFVDGEQERTPHHDVWRVDSNEGEPHAHHHDHNNGGHHHQHDEHHHHNNGGHHHHDNEHHHQHDEHHHHNNGEHHHHDNEHHHQHEGGQHGRTFAEIRALLLDSKLPESVLKLSLSAFTLLAEAEARVHGTTPDDVHFHEVGAVDAIIDIVGAAAAFVLLAPDEVVCAPPPLGRGFVQCQHGRLPLPAPAVLELLRGVPCVGDKLEAELVTPTGAALLRAFSTRFGDFPSMTIDRIGIGLGDARWPDRPNVLRLVLGRQETVATEEWIVETNVDDMSPEWVPPLLQSLLEAGAKDVWCTPTLMKKGRPGFVVSAIVDAQSNVAVTNTLFRESTTIGVRTFAINRTKLRREQTTVDTPMGPIIVKLAYDGEKLVNVAPELESCLTISRNLGIGLPDVFRVAEAALQKDYPLERRTSLLT